MKRRNAALLLAGALLALAPACEGDGEDDDRLAVTPAELAPDALVFAQTGSSSWLRGLLASWHGQRRGADGLWVYGDGTVVTMDRGALDGPCRTYRTTRLTAAELGALLELVRPGAWAAADGEHYRTCSAYDGGTTTLYVAAGSFTLRTSAYMGFTDTGCAAPEGEPAPPRGLDALSAALSAVAGEAAAPYDGGGLVVAGYWGAEPFLDECAAAATFEGAFLELAALAPAEPTGWSAVTLEGAAADAARAYFAAPPLSFRSFGLPNSVVRDGAACVLLTCDEVLPHDGVVDL
jgi:hypothetical protein